MTEDADAEAEWSPEELETWSSVATMLVWLPAALDAQLQRDAGLSHFEFGILFALDQADERTLTMSALAGFSNSSLSRLSRAVARLEKGDLIRRRIDAADGRVTLAGLTEKGQQAVRRAQPGHIALVRQLVFDTLTKAQAHQFGVIAQRIDGAIEAEGMWKPAKRVQRRG
ncbi:MarR family transcriptional regulator [Microbacterium sp. Mu-80]|uniref:MarR family transcriptional regulator n=1 Tax=Microbacterium bandirmense TaxID=3122050 RepID=A0ABU8LAP2_9MICO